MGKSLVVIEQRTVDFYGDELLPIRARGGHIYVSLRHLCEVPALARQGRVRRIRDSNILSKGYQGGNVLLPPSRDDRGGGMQSVIYLPLNNINRHRAIRTRQEHDQGPCPGVVTI